MNREVYSYDGKTLDKMITTKDPVISLSVDQEDNLWIGFMNGGVSRYRSDDFESSWEPEFLKNKSVTKVLHDHEGGLWFSTLENGVFHVPNLLIGHYAIPPASRTKSVVSTGNKVWVGKQNGTIFEIDAKTKEAQRNLIVEGPLTQMFSTQNLLWISSNTGIEIYDHNLKKIKETYGLALDYYESSDDKVYTVGGLRLRKFDNHGNLLRIDTVYLPYRSMLMQDSLFFLADRLGLHIKNKSMEMVAIPKDFIDVKISNILRFNDSTLLITSLGKGFFLMDHRDLTYKIYNSENNFIANNIYSSLLNDSILWLGTEKGLVRIPLSGFRKPGLSFTYLSKKSGLISDKIDFLVEADNAVWAFSDQGYSVIPHTFTKFTNTNPLFYIEELKANNTPVARNNIHHLNHDQNTIEVAFGFITFNNPNISLRYRLSEKQNWVYTQSKRLLFSSLAPGTYTFDLEFSTDNVHWIPATSPITFSIVPPWWSKWYTQLISFLTLLILGYLYFRHQQSIYRQKHHYLKIINDHQQKLIQSEIVALERERNRISKELHDRVGTNLTAIKLIVSQLLKNYKEPLAQDVEEQFQIALTEIKEIIYGLTPPSLERYGLFTGLKNYIGKLNKSIPITISLKTFGKDITKHELNIIVFRVIQELLTNSIKHSFARSITIHLNSFDDVLNIVYEDDGVGFSYDPLQSGLGLDNIESRIHSVNGSLKFDSGKFGISYTIDIPVTLNKEVA
jgi:signal transduction histidine kinase